MFTEFIALHQDGHGHEHPHAAEGAAPELTPEQTAALLSYMVEHNRSHADELHGVAHALEDQGKTDAAARVAEAVHLLDHSNEELEAALRLVREA